MHPDLVNLNKRSFEYHLSVLVQERRWLTQADLSRLAAAREGSSSEREFIRLERNFLRFSIRLGSNCR